MKRTLLSLIAVAALAAGCGGGDGGPTKAEYIARADRICQATKAETAPLVQQLTAAAGSGSVTTAQARKLARVAGRLQTMGAAYVARLKALDRPSGDTGDVDRFLTSSGQVVDALGRAAAALKTGNVTGALGLLQANTVTAAAAGSAAQAYGFKECVSVLPSGG